MWRGKIYQDVMNSSSCGSVFGFKKQHWATFSSPLRSLIVNSTRTNFSPHWKECSFSCRPVFGLKEHWPLEPIGTGFSAPVVLFLPKSNTGKRCSWGCVFLAWSSTGQGVKLRRSQVERARNLQDEKNSFEELLVRIFENFALQISRLEDLSIFVFAYQKVWGCEDEKICRCEEDTKLKKRVWKWEDETMWGIESVRSRI